MATKPKTIDEYLVVLPEKQRKVLQKLRKTIKTIVPDAEERISYSMPVRIPGIVITQIATSRSRRFV
jgi:uncharacterized protein YdhG (YjbR/CyaY superfamily)